MPLDQSQYPHAMMDDPDIGKPMPKMGVSLLGSIVTLLTWLGVNNSGYLSAADHVVMDG
jgi:hypothetical protein